ncbi:MAG: hypothetical protein BGN84_05780 [Afipia sp. 62-7]|nr:MAG: hypothetical protein BGN84_05780 [Afipia sp. 62-7]
MLIALRAQPPAKINAKTTTGSHGRMLTFDRPGGVGIALHPSQNCNFDVQVAISRINRRHGRICPARKI